MTLNHFFLELSKSKGDELKFLSQLIIFFGLILLRYFLKEIQTNYCWLTICFDKLRKGYFISFQTLFLIKFTISNMVYGIELLDIQQRKIFQIETTVRNQLSLQL